MIIMNFSRVMYLKCWDFEEGTFDSLGRRAKKVGKKFIIKNFFICSFLCVMQKEGIYTIENKNVVLSISELIEKSDIF